MAFINVNNSKTIVTASRIRRKNLLEIKKWASRLQQDLQGRRHKNDAADALRQAQARHVLRVLLSARHSKQQRASTGQGAEQLLHRGLPMHKHVSDYISVAECCCAEASRLTSKDMGVRCRKTSCAQNSSLLHASMRALGSH